MPDVELTDYIRTYLIEQGIVRDPRVAGPLPPIWRNPRDGAIEPVPAGQEASVEDSALAVVSVFDVGSVPGLPYEKFRRLRVIDFWVRAAKYPDGPPIERAIRDALHDKRDWSMAGLQVIESLLWRGPSSLGANERAFTQTIGYTFEIYA